MIELFENNNTSLDFTFPDVHPEIKLAIWFARQLRIPNCVEKCHLPRDIGEFKLRLIDDFPKRVPESWRKRGGVIMPMYQAEAAWIGFLPTGMLRYPFAVKVAAGKINAVRGGPWRPALSRDPQETIWSRPCKAIWTVTA